METLSGNPYFFPVLTNLCSFSYWILRLAKSQMRGPTLYNCRESFFPVWKRRRKKIDGTGQKSSSSASRSCCTVVYIAKKEERRAVGDCNWLRNLCVNEESLAREIDFDTRLGTKRESQEGAKSKDSSYLKKQAERFFSPLPQISKKHSATA